VCVYTYLYVFICMKMCTRMIYIHVTYLYVYIYISQVSVKQAFPNKAQPHTLVFLQHTLQQILQHNVTLCKTIQCRATTLCKILQHIAIQCSSDSPAHKLVSLQHTPQHTLHHTPQHTLQRTATRRRIYLCIHRANYTLQNYL